MGSTTVNMPDALEKGIEKELERGKYASKSELIRAAVRKLLEEEDMVIERTLSEETRERIERARQQEESIPHDEVFG